MSGKKKGKRKGGKRGRGHPRTTVPSDGVPVRKRDQGFRVPSVVMIPLGLAVGGFVAGWPGAVLGGVIGVFLWRSRA